jgi:hypothetical protein
VIFLYRHVEGLKNLQKTIDLIVKYYVDVELYYPPPGSKLHHGIGNTTPARALSRVDSE